MAMEVNDMKWTEQVAGSAEATNAAAAARTQSPRPRRRRTTEAPEGEVNGLELLQGMREVRVDMLIGLIGTGFIIWMVGARYAEGVVTMQGLTVYCDTSSLGTTGPVMNKSPKGAAYDHCDGILAAGNTGGSYLHAAAIGRVVPNARTLISQLKLGAAGQRRMIVLAAVPHFAEASPAMSAPSTGDNWCSSCVESRARGGAPARTRLRTTGTFS